MLSFFRSNQFLVAIPLAFYVILVHIGALTGYVQPLAHAAEGGLLYESWFGWVSKQPFYSAIIAVILVFIQAFTVNTLADEFRLMGERNWFPGLFYALTASALPDFLFVTAPLVAATFVPFSLWRIYKVYQKAHGTAAIFDGALWIAVASLFYPPCLWLLVAAYAGFGVVRVFRLQERFVFLSGAFVPLFLAWLWYFWADRGAEFRDEHWGSLFQLYRFDAVWDEKLMLKTVLVILLALIFLMGLGSLYSRKGIQAQKFVSVLYRFLVVGALSSLLQPEWRWEHIVLPASAMGILLAMTFQSLRNRFWAETCHLAILGFVMVIQFADFFLKLSLSIF
ncbi:MAG: hypothetical protein ACKVU0_18105 [Saprospiraceae bacterium]